MRNANRSSRASRPTEQVVLLDERGKQMTSQNLAEQARRIGSLMAVILCFVIGGPDGVAEDVQAREPICQLVALETDTAARACASHVCGTALPCLVSCKPATPITVSSDSPLLHLASSSPRRAELLDAHWALPTRWVAMDIDESRLPDEAAAAMVTRLAAQVRQQQHEPLLSTPVSLSWQRTRRSCWTTLYFGKPADQRDALKMLATAVRTAAHQVMTGVARATGPTASESSCRRRKCDSAKFILTKPLLTGKVGSRVAKRVPMPFRGWPAPSLSTLVGATRALSACRSIETADIAGRLPASDLLKRAATLDDRRVRQRRDSDQCDTK